jgi:hypothetical protein
VQRTGAPCHGLCKPMPFFVSNIFPPFSHSLSLSSCLTF